MREQNVSEYGRKNLGLNRLQLLSAATATKLRLEVMTFDFSIQKTLRMDHSDLLGTDQVNGVSGGIIS